LQCIEAQPCSCHECTEEQSLHSVCTKKKDPPKVKSLPQTDDAAEQKNLKCPCADSDLATYRHNSV